LDNIVNFLGKWHLVPENSQYEFGEPPKSGTYKILQKDNTLTFVMNWVNSQGEKQAVEYSEICDGKFYDYPVKEIADEIRLSLKNDALLESEAK